MTPEVGKTYWRKGASGKSVVMRVRAAGEWVEYDVLHGPLALRRKKIGRCKAKNFTGWEEIEPRADYSHLDGCKAFATFVVQDTAGVPILGCGEKRARFYLKNGYVKPVSEGVLRFTDDRTETRLRELYPGAFSEFFMAVKNDRCVCCGSAANLSRHHVIPRRHKRRIPQPWRACLSNVLFLCWDCHKRYEDTPEPDPDYAGDWQEYARHWKRHFLDTLNPRHVPAGWDIVPIKNLGAVKGPA